MAKGFPLDALAFVGSMHYQCENFSSYWTLISVKNFLNFLFYFPNFGKIKILKTAFGTSKFFIPFGSVPQYLIFLKIFEFLLRIPLTKKFEENFENLWKIGGFLWKFILAGLRNWSMPFQKKISPPFSLYLTFYWIFLKNFQSLEVMEIEVNAPSIIYPTKKSGDIYYLWILNCGFLRRCEVSKTWFSYNFWKKI